MRLLFLIAGLLLALSSVSGNLASDVLAVWEFTEGSGSVTFDSVNNIQGNITGATFTSGPNGDALNFDGNSQYVAVPDSMEQFESTGTWTIGTWVLFDELPTGSDNAAFYVHRDSTNEGLWYRWYAQQERIDLGIPTTGTSGYYREDWIPSLDTWYYVAVVYNGASNVTHYIDGVSINSSSASTSGDIHDNPVTAYIGGDAANSRWWHDGDIAQMSLWNRSLSGSELTQLYNSGSILPYSSWLPNVTNVSLTLIDAFDSSSINTFNATINGTTYTTTNGTINTDILSNITTLLNITYDAPDYFSNTTLNVNVSTVNVQSSLAQAYISFTCTEQYTNAPLTCSPDTVISKAGNRSTVLNSSGYIDNNLTYSVQALDNKTINATLHDYNLTVEANDYAGNPESDFNIQINSLLEPINQTIANNNTYFNTTLPVGMRADNIIVSAKDTFTLPLYCILDGSITIEFRAIIPTGNFWYCNDQLINSSNETSPAGPANATYQFTPVNISYTNTSNGQSITYPLLTGITYNTILNATSTIYGDPVNQIGEANITNTSAPPTSETYEFNLSAARPVKFNFYYEENLSNFTNNVTIELIPLTDSSTTYFTTTTSNGSAILYNIPVAEYRMKASSTGYHDENRFFILSTFSGQNITGYFRENTTGTDKSFIVVDERNRLQNGWVTRFQRYYNDSGWITVDSARSNIDGLSVQNLLSDEYYRVILLNEGLVEEFRSDRTLLLSDEYQISSDITTTTNTEINERLGVSGIIDYDSNTNTMRAIASSSSGQRDYTFKVYRQFVDGAQLVEQQSFTGDTVNLSIELPNASARYTGVLSIEDNVNVFSSDIETGGGPQAIGSSGAVYSLILILAITGVSIFSAGAAIVLAIMTLIISTITGLFVTGISAIIGLIIIGGMIIMRREV